MIVYGMRKKNVILNPLPLHLNLSILNIVMKEIRKNVQQLRDLMVKIVCGS
jgi:hypothetical protein